MVAEQNPEVLTRRDVMRLANLPWLVPTCLRAVGRLIAARFRFAIVSPRRIEKRNAQLAKDLRGAEAASAEDRQLVRRIAFVMPRIAGRLPFRADCLVQALAAQEWLASAGIASRIAIGVELPEGQPFGAHAWLVHGDCVVTGGEIAQYSPLL